MTKMRMPLGALLSLSMTLLPVHALAQEATDPGLEKGVALAQQGDFEEAVITLDAAARRLAAERGRAPELARAYLYLAISYLGLSQEQKAKAQFLQAWKTDKGMELSPSEFPPRILEFFDKAREEAIESGQIQASGSEASPAAPEPPTAEAAAPETAGAPAPPPATAEAAEPAQKGHSKALPIVLGAVGGTALIAGLAIAAGGGDGSSSGGSGPSTPTVQTVTINSTQVPVNIPDLGIATSQVNVSTSGTIQEAVVIFDITHTWRGDLALSVQHPDGSVFLVTAPADSEDIWRDQVTMPTMVNKPASGTWTLRVADVQAGDSGRLNSWGLRLTVRR